MRVHHQPGVRRNTLTHKNRRYPAFSRNRSTVIFRGASLLRERGSADMSWFKVAPIVLELQRS
eukprot:1167060-Pyramimonas_sp.AAC.1